MARPKRKQSSGGSTQSAKKAAKVAGKRSITDAKESEEASPAIGHRQRSEELADTAEAGARGKKRQRGLEAAATGGADGGADQELAAEVAAEVAEEVAEVDALWSKLRSEAAPSPSDAPKAEPAASHDAGSIAGSEAAYLSRQMEAFGPQLAALRDDEAFDAHSMPRLIEFLAAGRRALGGC